MDWRENYGGLRCLTALYFGPDKGLELLGALTEHLAKGEGEAALDAYTALYRWLRAGEWKGLGDWLRDRLLDAETPYGRLTGKGGAEESLTAAARAECALLTELASLPGFAWKQALTAALPESFTAAVAALPEWSGEVPFDFESLTRAYETDGCGLFARCRAFLWTGGELIPVPDPDRPGAEEMLGYEWQRREVIDNTAALLSGKLVNNALLFGEGGTGKSATVKSLLAVPGFEKLRLIEVEKEGLADLPVLIRSLAGRRQKFILFIDDLAFDQDDRTYSTLKTILEGGTGEAAGERGHLRHLQPPQPGAPDLLRPGGGRGGRRRDRGGKDLPGRALRPANPLSDLKQGRVPGHGGPDGRPVWSGDGPGGAAQKGGPVGAGAPRLHPPHRQAVHRQPLIVNNF